MQAPPPLNLAALSEAQEGFVTFVLEGDQEGLGGRITTLIVKPFWHDGDQHHTESTKKIGENLEYWIEKFVEAKKLLDECDIRSDEFDQKFNNKSNCSQMLCGLLFAASQSGNPLFSLSDTVAARLDYLGMTHYIDGLVLLNRSGIQPY